MNLTKNISKHLILIFAIAMIFLIAPTSVEAAASLSLPTSVTAIVQDGSESHFVTELSNVPSNYSISNGTYLGWCIDAHVVMTRNETFEAILYSSLNPPSGNWSTARWDMVNYILNHKQGDANDIQQAIWFFINNTTNFNQTLTADANATINDALANGTGFQPAQGQIVAAIVFPQIILPGSGPFQDSIIEIQTPQALTANVTVSGAQLIGTNSYHMDSGATATFTANVVGGTQPYGYVWYVNGTSSGSAQSMNFTAPQTGTYSIYANVTDSSNPTLQATSATVTVTVPEYSLLAILLLGALMPIAIIIRRRKSKN